jgi:hypothetical protein
MKVVAYLERHEIVAIRRNHHVTTKVYMDKNVENGAAAIQV